MKTTLVALTSKLQIVNDVTQQKDDFESQFLKSEQSRQELHKAFIDKTKSFKDITETQSKKQEEMAAQMKTLYHEIQELKYREAKKDMEQMREIEKIQQANAEKEQRYCQEKQDLVNQQIQMQKQCQDEFNQ